MQLALVPVHPKGTPRLSSWQLRSAGKTRWGSALLARVCSTCTRFYQGLSGADACHANRQCAVQIREGRVKSISAKAAGALKQDGWVFLDVRPPPEIEKATSFPDRFWSS